MPRLPYKLSLYLCDLNKALEAVTREPLRPPYYHAEAAMPRLPCKLSLYLCNLNKAPEAVTCEPLKAAVLSCPPRLPMLF